MDVSLVMFTPDGTRREFPVKKNRVVVGRTNSCGLRVPLSSVSREHCELTIRGDEIVLRDLGSSNGTFHNNLRIQEAEVLPGDEISIGPVVFTVVVDGKPEDIEPVRSEFGGAESGGDMFDESPMDFGDDDDLDVAGLEQIPADESASSVRDLAEALESDHEDMALPELLEDSDQRDLAAALESDEDMDLDMPDIEELSDDKPMKVDDDLDAALESDEEIMELPDMEQIDDDDDSLSDALSPIVELDDPLGALNDNDNSDEFPELVFDDDD